MVDGGHPSQRQDHEDSLLAKHHLRRKPGGARKTLEARSGRKEGRGTQMGAEVIITLEFTEVIQDSAPESAGFNLFYLPTFLP